MADGTLEGSGSVACDPAERNLIGALVWWEDDKLEAVQDLVRAEDFEEAHARRAYEGLLAVKRPIGAERTDALVRWLGGGSWSSEWALWLLDCYKPEASSSFACYFARTIRDRSILRAAKEHANETAQAEVNLGVPENLDQFLGDARVGFEELSMRAMDRAGETERRSFEGVVEASLRRANGDRLKTGLADLDRMLFFEPSDYVLVAARPSTGKTAFAIQIALNLIRAQRYVLLLSLEMASQALAMRMLANVSQVPHWRIRSGRLSTEDIAKLKTAEQELQGLRLAIVEKGCTTAEAVRGVIEREIRQPDLVVVDYIQLLNSKIQSRSRVEEISAVSRVLKQATKDFQVPLLVVSQLSRAAERGERPSLAHLRDSGALEQDADIVIGLWEAEEKNRLHAALLKNRNGPVGDFDLFFDPEIQRIGSLALPQDGSARPALLF